jgi:hypothetical protein
MKDKYVPLPLVLFCVAAVIFGWITGRIILTYTKNHTEEKVIELEHPTALVCAGPATPVPVIIYSSKPITRYEGAYVLTSPDNQLVYFEKMAMERCTAVPDVMAKNIEKAISSEKPKETYTQTHQE